MSITRLNSNAEALLANAQLKKLELSMTRTMNRLATGIKINTSADDPSGVTVVNNMRSELGALRKAIRNAEDTLGMMNVVDSAMGEVQDKLQRLNDLAVAASNAAVTTSAQRSAYQAEWVQIYNEITDMKGQVSFNGKYLFSAMTSGITAHVGPGTDAANYISLYIPTMSIGNEGPFGGNGSLSAINLSTDPAAISAEVFDVINSAINSFSKMQALVGSQERNLEDIIATLQAAEVNMTSAASRIMDADMAMEISEFSRQQVVAQAAVAMIAQANVQPQTVLSLLGA
jgi:flagellin